MSGNNHHPSRNEYERMMRNVRNEPIYRANRAKAKAEAKARWAAMPKREKQQAIWTIVYVVVGFVLMIVIKSL